jgi:pilus assembly protein Flp/PilA
MKTKVMQFLRNQKGLTTVEYAVAGGLISLALVGGFTILGGQVDAVIRGIAALLP